MRLRGICLCLLAAAAARPMLASNPELTANFTTTGPVAVPGLTLPVATFSIAVVGHAGGRYIMRVEDQMHDPLATFLGVPNDTMATASTSGRVDWPKPIKGVPSLKGWYFPAAHVGVEFVYPKAEAVALAQTNQAQVVAIDPASDGLGTDLPSSLTPTQMHTVTLWALTLTHTGPAGSAPGIAAAKYSQVASVQRKPVVRRLPHTASSLPWAAFVGSLALIGAGEARRRRMALASEPS